LDQKCEFGTRKIKFFVILEVTLPVNEKGNQELFYLIFPGTVVQVRPDSGPHFQQLAKFSANLRMHNWLINLAKH